MEIRSLYDLLGVKEKSVDWQYAFLFFAALFISAICFFIFSPGFYYAADEGYGVEFFRNLSAWNWLDSIVHSLLMTILILVSLRYFAKVWIALLVTMISYALLSGLSSSYLILQNWATISDADVPSYWTYFLNGIPNRVLYVLFFFGCLALALRFIRHLLPALLVGTLSGSLLMCLFLLLRNTFADTEFNIVFWLLNLIPGFVWDIIFAVVLYYGILLTDKRLSETAGQKIRLNKGFYQIALAVLYGVPLVLSCSVYIHFSRELWEQSNITPALILMLLAFIFLIGGIVTFCTFIYKMWTSIQDGSARTTPARAVGFLFIPVFNFFWVFKALYGFTLDYNNFIQRHSVNVEKLSPAVFVIFILLTFTGFLLTPVPIASYFFSLLAIIFLLFMVSIICNAVNALPKEVKV